SVDLAAIRSRLRELGNPVTASAPRKEPEIRPPPAPPPAPTRPTLHTPAGPVGWDRRVGWLLALAISVTIGAALVRVMSGYAIPPGQDEGQWIATSYAYVGLPYPSEIIPLAYPPALFPVLGILVRILGGPARAALAFVGIVTVLLGLVSYQLARTLVGSVPLALAAETAFLLFPSVVRMDFWGGYPTLLGLVFSCLALTYLNRYVATPRPTYALVFWVAAAIAILSESLVASMLGATLVIMAVLLTVAGSRPWRILLNRGGVVGAAIFAALVGGFYAVTAVLKVPHANYASASQSAHILSDLGTFFAPVVGPFGLHVNPTAAVTFVALALLSGVILLILLATAIWTPGRLNTTDITLGAWTAGVMGLAVAGWVLNVVSVYGRFGYLLILPIILAAAYGIRRLDSVLDEWWSRRQSPEDPDGLPAWTPPASANSSPTVQRFGLKVRARPLRALLGVLVVLALLVLTDVATVPSVATDERFFAQPGHDQNYTAALRTIQASGIPGGILVGVPQVGRWPRALILRNPFSPLDPSSLGTQDFYPSKVLDSELAYFALTDSLAVTNGLVSASYAGNNSSAITGLPDYEAFYYGHTTQVLRLDPTQFSVELQGGHFANPFNLSNGVPNVTISSTTSGQLTFQDSVPGVSGTIVATAVPGKDQIVLSVSVAATGSLGLVQVNATLATAKSQPAVVNINSAADTFSWSLNKNTGLVTNGAVFPTSVALSQKTPGGPNAPRLSLTDHPGGAKAVRSLNFTVTLSTPSAQNLIPSIPSVLITPQIWRFLGVSFVLLAMPPLQRNTPLNGTLESQYLTETFGATNLPTLPPWIVLRLPTS
ncbi:MAG: ArnT family glycosyltransferase, partial [Candidatus Lutacidiplasmatales archaeon]